MKKVFCITLLTAFFILPAFSQTWHQLTGFTPYGPGIAPGVSVLKVINGKLYIGGGFGGECPDLPPPNSYQGPGGNDIAIFDGTTWDSLGNGIYGLVHAIEYYNGEIYAGYDGGGSGSYACTGQYWPNNNIPNTNSIAKWNGTKWLPVDSVLSSYPYDVLALQYENDLYIGGNFYNVSTDNGNAKSIIKYNLGATDNMLGGLDLGVAANEVTSMVVWNGELYVAGAFKLAGSVHCNNIAKWNGTQWDSVGGGVDSNGMIMSLAIDSINNILYATGYFESAGGNPAHCVAKWDGNNWTALGIPPQWSNGFSAIGLFKGEVYVAGAAPNNSPMDSTLIRWDGTKWHPVFGVNGEINAFTLYKGNFYIGGVFTKIDTTTVNGIACYGDSCPGNVIPFTLAYGVYEYDQGLKFKIFPNPAKSELNIDVIKNVGQGVNEKYIVRIKSSIGQEIFQQQFTLQLKIDVSKFPKGLCLVEVCTSEGKLCHTEKIVIQ